MSVSTTPAELLGGRLHDMLAHRTRANERFFAAEADRIAELCHRMAERFARGGRLIALGASPPACSDVRHVTVEFVHPVIVGKRALPAIGVTRGGGPLALQMELFCRPDDIAIAFGDVGDAPEPNAEIREAVATVRRRGCLTIAFHPCGAEWEFLPPSDDPFVRQELAETLYHILWELVHVFFEHPGLLAGRTSRAVHDVGGSSFLYPFLAQQETGLDTVLRDVARSARMKAAEISELRVRTVGAAREVLLASAAALRTVLDAGGTVLVFGNGGSATDAMDLVADLRTPPHGWPARRALDLTEDPAVLTAIANDIGTDAIFSRQVIAYGGPGDAAIAISTSGSSRNIVQALAEARSRGMATVALVGYDGGRILAERLAEHVIVTPSEHIPRIQEAQATVCHLLRELLETVRDQPE